MGRHIGSPSLKAAEEGREGFLGFVSTCWRKSAPREELDAGERKSAGREAAVLEEAEARTEVGEALRRSIVVRANKRSVSEMPIRSSERPCVGTSPTEMDRAWETMVALVSCGDGYSDAMILVRLNTVADRYARYRASICDDYRCKLGGLEQRHNLLSSVVFLNGWALRRWS